MNYKFFYGYTCLKCAHYTGSKCQAKVPRWAERLITEADRRVCVACVDSCETFERREEENE